MKSNESSIQPVFYWAVGILSLVIISGVAIPNLFETVTSNVQAFISSTFGWYYLIAVTFFMIVCLFIIFSPYGKIKLGKDDDKPEFGYLSWFAMLFSAGMGIGLVFFGVAEPISHFAINSPTVDEGTVEAARESMRFVFFHYGIHAWGIYAIIAICLAYFTYRKGKSGLISGTLSPLMNTDGLLGKVIDTFALIATVTGIVTSLGFGAVQMNGGISYLTDLPISFWLQAIIIVIVTILFLTSAMTGIDKGIRILSNFNMLLALLLLLFIAGFGATLYSMNLFTNTLGTYLQTLPELSFRIAPGSPESRSWINDWTIFYWAWWIAWSPYVGTFIARVSRGRTLREFTVAVLIVPSIVGFIWFSIVGGTGMSLELNDVISLSSLGDEEMMFGLLSTMPISTITSILTIGLIAVFFITSADSATFVLGMHSTNGSLNPPNKIKFTWGVILAAMAIVLLYSGGLQALQNVMIIAAFPFSIILLLMVFSLLKSLRYEQIRVTVQEKKEIRELRQWKRKQEKEAKKEKSANKKMKRKKGVEPVQESSVEDEDKPKQ
ncbi:glycine betaine transporter [Alkalihalobacillus xiaoxiensis]|uniref:Glycine betaine transporter n=1 Tax=Shouchella xiaoxiensis TaxID=766895 RepID=A0ABS2SMY9_9BACI|nr:BCCT family transporter [Shouchella xiaoxiensis]MBM7836879.1 glycine betaine transporter [Shouchella xiaoxiensis]